MRIYTNRAWGVFKPRPSRANEMVKHLGSVSSIYGNDNEDKNERV